MEEEVEMCPSLHWMPIAVFVALPVTFITSFIIAVSLGHVEAAFPYISDTGTTSPESCIFGQLLNISAVLVGCNFYIRYKQLQCHLNRHDNPCLVKVNKASFVLGLVTSLGISMVGNFQETNVLTVHLIGAMFAFGVGGIYCCIHAVISYKTSPHLTTLVMCHIRSVLAALIIITFIATFILDSVARKHYTAKNPRKWFPHDGGFTYHILSTTSEWMMAACFMFYMLTFADEFRKVRMVHPKVHIVETNMIGLLVEESPDTEAPPTQPQVA